MIKKEQNHFRMMIVEDEEDLREIVSLILSEELNCEFVEFAGAYRAIEYLKTNPHIDLIISDFNMPAGNGAVLEAYVREHFPETPFILMTSNDRQRHNELLVGPKRGYLPKPFRSKDLQDTVKACLQQTGDVVFVQQQYVPVSVGILQGVGAICCSLYLKLGNSHYVKLINAGNDFDEAVIDRLHVKGISHLYIEKENIPCFLGEYKERVLNKMYIKSMKERPSSALALAKGTKELLVVAAKTMNWSDELLALGTENIHMVQNMVGADQSVKDLFDWFAEPSAHELGIGSGFFLSYLLVSLSQKLKLEDPLAVEKLTMAAFFHDLALDDYHIQNQSRFVNALRLGGVSSKENLEVIRQHPEKARMILSDWKNCPSEVLNIIEQHHEYPDGSGFPKGLKDEELHPLSRVFIIANEVNEIFQRVRVRSSIIAELSQRGATFKVGQSQFIFSTMLQILEGGL